MSPGLERNKAGGHFAGKRRIAAKGSLLASTNERASYGRTIRPAEAFGGISRPIF
jgi:hypothetical protein